MPATYAARFSGIKKEPFPAKNQRERALCPEKNSVEQQVGLHHAAHAAHAAWRHTAATGLIFIRHLSDHAFSGE